MELRLIGPDSRFPVDWDLRRALLEDITACSLADLAEHWPDGREKLFVTGACCWLMNRATGLVVIFAARSYPPSSTMPDCLNIIGRKGL